MRGLKEDVDARNSQVEEAGFGRSIAELQTLIAEDRANTLREYKSKADQIEAQVTKFEQQIYE